MSRVITTVFFSNTIFVLFCSPSLFWSPFPRSFLHEMKRREKTRKRKRHERGSPGQLNSWVIRSFPLLLFFWLPFTGKFPPLCSVTGCQPFGGRDGAQRNRKWSWESSRISRSDVDPSWFVRSTSSLLTRWMDQLFDWISDLSDCCGK